MRHVYLVFVLLLLGSSIVSAQETVVDAAAERDDLTTLVTLIEAAGVAETLNAEGPFTVFAPTNAAFGSLPPFVVEYLVSEAGQEVLIDILTYHVVPGQVMAADVAEGLAANEGEFTVTALVGDALTFAGDAETGITVNQANLLEVDLEVGNGVIHLIDAPLIPTIELPFIIAADVEGDIVTAGSSTVAPLSLRMADEFVLEGFTGEIITDIIGSGAGFERFCETGETDIANASRPIRDSEVDACGQLAPARDPIGFRIGTDALAIVVNPRNTFAQEMTLDQLALAFSSAETWADVDPSWPEEPIVRYSPDPLSGTFDYFVEEVLGEDADALLTASRLLMSPNDIVLEEGVAENIYAIGYFGYAYYAQHSDELSVVNIEGIQPNAASVDDGTYPLARPLFIYSDTGIIDEKPQVGEFIKYYLSNVNRVIEEVGYFPANPDALNRAKLFALAANA